MLARSEHSFWKLISFAVDWEWKFLIGLKMIFTFVDSHMCFFDNRLKNFMTVSIFYKGRIQCWALLFQSGTLTDLMHHRGWVVNLYKLFFPSVHHSFLCLMRLVPYKVFSSHTSDTAEKAEENHGTTNEHSSSDGFWMNRKRGWSWKLLRFLEQCQIVINLHSK